MKKRKIFALTLLTAALVAGCSKSEPGPDADGTKAHISIFTSQMEGSKTSIDPSNPGAGENWIAGEEVTLNGIPYQIVAVDDHYGIDTEPLDVAMTSFYPYSSNGNDVEVVGNDVVLNRLNITFNGDKQSMPFPMVATAEAGASSLYYSHLSAGFQLTLTNGQAWEDYIGDEPALASLTIMAQSDQQVENLGVGDYKARWAVEGPQVPLGPVGQNGNNIDVKYASVMNFDIDYAVGLILPEESRTFCVPVTISSVKKLTLVGYDENGDVLFNVSKTFDQPIAVQRNRMYSLPPITFNYD